jgi:hypothetical protein
VLESDTENLGCFLVTIAACCGLADETPAIIVLPQKRLVGERMVVKEIEIFGNFQPALFMMIRHEVACDRREEQDLCDV